MGSLANKSMFFRWIESVPTSQRYNNANISSLGWQGLELQTDLEDWFRIQKETGATSDHDRLAEVYYHTLTLFVARNYTYYDFWQDMPRPKLTSDQQSQHISSIVTLLQGLCKDLTISGVLFLFPLRVAGSLATDAATKAEIFQLLDTVHRQGFVVAQRVRVDLEELYTAQAICSV